MKKILLTSLIVIGLIIVVWRIVWKVENPYYIVNTPDSFSVASTAVAQKDISICGKITSSSFSFGGPSQTELRSSCYSKAAYTFGETLHDKSFCQTMPSQDLIDQCLDGMAISTLNESLCPQNHNIGYYGNCYNEIAMKKNDLGMCARLDDQANKGQCYFLVNKTFGDISVCNKITDQKYKDSCFYDVLIFRTKEGGSGLTESDKSLCQQISSSDTKSECLRYYNSYNQKHFKTNTPENNPSMY